MVALPSSAGAGAEISLQIWPLGEGENLPGWSSGLNELPVLLSGFLS